MANFNLAFKLTLGHEGGYSNHSADSGGKTRFGITEKVARLNGYNGDMKELPLQVAEEIYKNNYWNSLKLDKIENQSVANELFDTAVNMGVKIAAKFLQESINLLTDWKCKVDMIIGEQTLTMANRIDPKNLLKCLNGLQFNRYVKICFLRPSQKVFFKGWLNRVY